MAKRVNVTLDDEHAAKLAQMAERAHISDGTLARSLLSVALEEADPDARHVTDVLEGIPGAVARIREGEAQVDRGEFADLDRL